LSSEAFILAACRSPIVPIHGALKNIDIFSLGASVADECIRQSGIQKSDIHELILANVLGPGGNPARSISLKLALNESVAGITIDRQCASGLDALNLAKILIQSGHQDVVLAGGVESYSQKPKVYLQNCGTFSNKPMDQAPFTPWPEHDPDMATTANALAQKIGISRDEQDSWAIRSHALARKNSEQLQNEIVPVAHLNTLADHYTRNLTQAICQRAKPIIGSITHANTSVSADGAAFFVVASQRFIMSRGLHGVRVVRGVTIGHDAMLPGLAIVPAIQSVLHLEGLDINNLNAIELMEAYAAQALACIKTLRLNHNVINKKGGSLARGHPIGASGAVLAVRLFHELQSTGGYGLAAIPSAGGIGTAVILAQ